MDPTTLRLIQGASGAGNAGIEFVASAQTQNSSDNSITVDKPTGTQAGDLLIAACAANGSVTWTGDTGWTEVVDQGVIPALRIAYLVAGASEPASYTFTLSKNNNRSAVITAFRNAAYNTVGTISTSASSGIQTASAITLSASASAILAFFVQASDNRTWSNPTSGLISTASDSDGISPSWALYRELNLPSGSTGTRSSTCSATGGTFACVLVGITPV